MHFPRYWAKGSHERLDKRGQPRRFSCWGWSDVDLRQAERAGREKAVRLANMLVHGERPPRYPYGDRPLREEVLQALRDGQGTIFAAISRNSYGCHILNTASIMFVDVDFPAPALLETIRYRFRKLWNPSTPSLSQRYEAQALAKLKALLQADRRHAVRVYRTRAGLRYLFTGRQFDPRVDPVRGLMQSLDADPLYVRLCASQESFRARLTPKPWRCGLPAPAVRWPWPDSPSEARFRQWESQYTAAAQPFAACKLLHVFGDSPAHPTIISTVEIHDRLTKASSDLALA